MTKPESLIRRHGFLIALALYMVILLIWSLAPGHPRPAGLYHDDGIYMCLGRSLIERGTYRDDHTPEPIQIAKYPPGTPCLAALCLTLDDDPENAISWLRVIHVMFLGLGLWSLYHLLSGEGKTGQKIAPWLVAATALSPPLFDYLRLPMSEIPFFGLLLLALLLTRNYARTDKTAWRQAIPLALICLAILFFRSVGLAAAMAIGSWLLLARRWAVAWRFAIVFLIPAIALQLWLRSQASPAPGFSDISVYGLPYSKIMAAGLGDLPGIMFINLVQSCLYLFHLVIPGAMHQAFAMGTSGFWLLWTGALLTLLLLILGLRAELGEPRADGFPRLRPRHLLLLFTLAMVIPWPFQTSRFLVPLIPLLLIPITRGAGVLAGKWAPITVAGLTALLGLTVIASRPPATPGSFAMENKSHDLRAMQETGDWLKNNIPPKSVIASTMDPYFAVHHDLKGVWGWTIKNQVTDLYGGELNLLHFGFDLKRYPMINNQLQLAARLFAKKRGEQISAAPQLPPPDDQTANWLLKEMEKDQDLVAEQFRRLGVTHAILLLRDGQRLYEVLLARLIAKLAAEGKAVPLFRSQDGAALVWRLRAR